MKYISSPLTFIVNAASEVAVVRDIEDRMARIDNLVELIVFTPRGSFDADPDFGFEYWNHEFSNVHYREFNNDQTGVFSNGMYNEITKKECQESIRQSLATYEPQLKHVVVGIELAAADVDLQRENKVRSKYMVTISVEGVIEDGLGTTSIYKKNVSFLMEPTARKYGMNPCSVK